MTPPRDPEIVVRPASPADATAIAEAHVRAWQAAYSGVMPQDYLDALDVAERAERWRARLAGGRGDSVVLVGATGERVVGFATIGTSRDATSDPLGELWALNVHPAAWGSGVGPALLAAALAGLVSLGHERAILWVVPSNARARRFYERHGWVPDAVERVIDIQGVTLPEVRYSRALP
jgi:GNAT superfamily N-acetyltransferase